MGYPTPIEWTDATWNPIGGCAIESPGCADCYAQKLAGTRLKNHPLYKGTTTLVKGKPVFNGKLTNAQPDHPVWSWPLRWKGAPPEKRNLGHGPSLIFVGDMSDLFHPNRPFAVVDRVVAAIVYSRHVGQLLTKRPAVMNRYFNDLRGSARWRQLVHPITAIAKFMETPTFEEAVVRQLWPGTSAERQKEFDDRWPHLRELAMRGGFTVFVSYEPALAPLVLPKDFLALGPRAQVIAGGKSGKADAPAHPDWFRRVRDQCESAGVAFFFKQWGEWAPAPPGRWEGEPERVGSTYHPGNKPGDLWVGRDGYRGEKPPRVWCPADFEIMRRVGKKAAGRLLDGKEHNGFPALAA